MVKKKISLTKLNCFMKAKTTSCVCCFNALMSSRALCPHFSVCFSILITSLREEGAGRCASRTFVCFARLCPFPFPLGVEVWLWFVIVAYPGPFY